MSELTNLTDRITHLRDRKSGSKVLSNPEQPPHRKTPKKRPQTRSSSERKVATDYFMCFVYALLAVSIAIQIGLIASLDF